MKTAHRILAIALFALIGATLVARADNADLKELLSGKQFPLSLQLKDLDGTWRRVRVSPSDSSGVTAMYSQILNGGKSSIYYTKGEVIVLAGLTYVIAYQLPTPVIDTAALMRGNGTLPMPQALTPESPLTLAFIQLHTAGSLTDIRPFNLEEEIAEQTGVHQAIEAGRDKSANDRSVNNLKQIGLAVFMYADDHNDQLPDLSDAQTLQKALKGYLKDGKVFVHPNTGEPYQSSSSLSGRKLKELNPRDEFVLVFEAKPAADGTRAALFGDGHVERVTESRWQELKKISNIP